MTKFCCAVVLVLLVGCTPFSTVHFPGHDAFIRAANLPVSL